MHVPACASLLVSATSAACTTICTTLVHHHSRLDPVREPVARLLLHTACPCGLVRCAQLVNSSQPNPHNWSHGFLFSLVKQSPIVLLSCVIYGWLCYMLCSSQSSLFFLVFSVLLVPYVRAAVVVMFFCCGMLLWYYIEAYFLSSIAYVAIESIQLQFHT